MNELIKITETNGKKAVSARELHSFLESKQEFAPWIKNRIKKYELIENEDYVSFDKLIKRETGAATSIEYALSLDAAKELSMVEGNAKGKQARKYFIECEKVAQGIAAKEPEELLLQSVQLMIEQKKRMFAIENRMTEIEAKTITSPDYFTIVGYATINKMQIGLKVASRLGMKAAKICKEKGYQMDDIPDPRFGRVHSYPKTVLQQVFNESLI